MSAVEIRGQRELRARLNAITDTRALLRRLQIDTTKEAQLLAPHRTGHLVRTIQPGAFSGREALVHARAPYAAAVELGSRPHEIRPRNRRALRFPAAGVSTTLGGRVRTGEVRRLGRGAYAFAMVVHHPGTKPHPFLLPGAVKAARGHGLPDTIVQLWNRAA